MLAASQSYFHHKSENHCFPHIFGSSHHNQRIETWWSQLYRLKSSFIIDMLKDLVQYYNCDDELQKAMARYCFGPLIYFFPDSNVCDFLILSMNTSVKMTKMTGPLLIIVITFSVS